jgi:hypothetical protein
MGTALVCDECGQQLWRVESNGVVRFPNDVRIDLAKGEIYGHCSCATGLHRKDRRTCNARFSVSIGTALAMAIAAPLTPGAGTAIMGV